MITHLTLIEVSFSFQTQRSSSESSFISIIKHYTRNIGKQTHELETYQDCNCQVEIQKITKQLSSLWNTILTYCVDAGISKFRYSSLHKLSIWMFSFYNSPHLQQNNKSNSCCVGFHYEMLQEHVHTPRTKISYKETHTFNGPLTQSSFIVTVVLVLVNVT